MLRPSGSTSSPRSDCVRLKLHIENAYGYGATIGAILQETRIAAVLGIHTVMMSASILLEEIAANEGQTR